MMGTFDGPTTNNYVNSCIALVMRIINHSEPQVSGADLVSSIQTELAIPTVLSEIPPAGLLGLCVHLITIVQHDEEDPIECIVRALTDAAVNFSCFPGSYDRQS